MKNMYFFSGKCSDPFLRKEYADDFSYSFEGFYSFLLALLLSFVLKGTRCIYFKLLLWHT